MQVRRRTASEGLLWITVTSASVQNIFGEGCGVRGDQDIADTGSGGVVRNFLEREQKGIKI